MFPASREFGFQRRVRSRLPPPALSHVRTRLPRRVGRLASTCGYHCPLGGSGLSGCGCHTPGIWAVSLPAVLVWNELRGRAGTENCRAPTPSARQDGCDRRREAAAHADGLAARRPLVCAMTVPLGSAAGT